MWGRVIRKRPRPYVNAGFPTAEALLDMQGIELKHRLSDGYIMG